MKVRCDALDAGFELKGRPERIISLVSSATETLADIGCAERLIGVSPYCSRYVTEVGAPVVGDYLSADADHLQALEPDLVLTTSGVQLPLAKRLSAAGLPVFVLPLPANRFAIWDNIITVGALAGRLDEARDLAWRCESRCADLVAKRQARRPRVYIELWFGRHVRMCGGRGFMHDMVSVAGGDPVFGSEPSGYLTLDVAAAKDAEFSAMVLFHEPEYTVDPEKLLRERGWDHLDERHVITSTVDKGRNVIHDGPSFCDTAAWLADGLDGMGT